MNYSTDLQVAKDLEKLCLIVNEAIERASNILNEAKEIDEIKNLIQELHMASETLESSKKIILKIELFARDKLAEAQRIEEGLQDLKGLPEQLKLLGIDHKILKELKDIFNAVQETKREIQETKSDSDRLLEQSTNVNQKTTKLSEQLDGDTRRIEQIMRVNKTIVADAQAIMNQIGGTKQINELLEEIKTVRAQLNESRQQMLSVRSLERYLQEFQRHRNNEQLLQWLREELGFVGILVYFISLITPKNSRGR